MPPQRKGNKKGEKGAVLRTIVLDEIEVAGATNYEAAGAHALITNSSLVREGEEDFRQDAIAVAAFLRDKLPSQTYDALFKFFGLEAVRMAELRQKVNTIMVADQITPEQRFEIARELFGLERVGAVDVSGEIQRRSLQGETA